jgi:hypothetical protein
MIEVPSDHKTTIVRRNLPDILSVVSMHVINVGR